MKYIQIALSLALLPVATAQTPIDAVGPLAINFHHCAFWNSTWEFTDAMVDASPWVAQSLDFVVPIDNSPLAQLDSDGWPIVPPGEAASTALFRGFEGHYPGGVYELTWEGTGAFEFHFDAAFLEQVAPRHVRLLVTPSDAGMMLKLVASDAADPVRNLRMAMPGFAGQLDAVPFHPDFLTAVEPFGALRFMLWQNTNFSTLSSWADRPLVSDATQATEKGVALEWMVDLCNRSGKGGWFCMPTMADDNFVREFARYVAQNLEPGLPAFIEYANEAWNGGFLAFSYCQTQGIAAGIQGFNDFEIGMRWYSQRSVEIFDIWRSEFEAVHGTAWSDHLVRVLGGQHVNTFVSELVLDHNQAYQSADALAVAPYFGFEYGLQANVSETLTKSVDQILSELELEVANDITPQIAANVALAQSRGLSLIAYEGGQHLAPVGPASAIQALVDKLAEVNRDPGMYDVTTQFLDAWAASGASFLAPFSLVEQFSSFGAFGHKEYLDQPLDETPKYRALLDHLGITAGDVTAFGESCQDLSLDSSGAPLLGAGTFYVTLSGAPAGTPVSLIVSDTASQYFGVPLPIPLGWAGAPGCNLLVGQGPILPYSTDTAGHLLAQLPLPANPGLVGLTIYLQGAVSIPGFGLLQLGFTRALAVTLAG